ncbi:Hypothetical protein SRAE_1000085100 [Strongyloides ratti]|uniref:Uncharacterized protein n=1 Tax=Strongyloides ratti TaxID=34506 RepID=A0A090KYR7_STRRB|nr:Hypothetical protein SRAE_1000085100 [Strongyloides ratti]CEF62581.1 Hypothetical protein SRAE_1000085100 [Strongyloides ratti]
MAGSGEKTLSKDHQQYLDNPSNDALYNHIQFDDDYNVIEKRSRNPYAWSKILKRDTNQGRYFFEPVSYLDIPPFVQVNEKNAKVPYSWKYNQIYGKRGRNPYSWQVNPAYQKREYNQGNWFSFRPTRNPYAWANIL